MKSLKACNFGSFFRRTTHFNSHLRRLSVTVTMEHSKSNVRIPRTGKRNDAAFGTHDETYVPPSLARFYLTHLTATLIHYQGFTSCQAGVIAELERKLESREFHLARLVSSMIR